MFLGEAVLASEFRSDFSLQPDRRWPGPEWNANRWGDWQLKSGWLECTEERPRFPVRTCALLTEEIEGQGVGFTVRVETRGVQAIPRTSSDWAGFLFGIGNPEIDYRIRALVHGMPAEDGGVLAVVDGEGRVAFREFSQRPDRVGYWSIDGPLARSSAPILQEKRRSGEGLKLSQRSEPITLELEIRRLGDGTFHAILKALRRGTEEVSRAELKGLTSDRTTGSIALASHGGVDGAGHAFRRVHLSGSSVRTDPERTFGPVCGVLYTHQRQTLKVTAQLAPLGPSDPSIVELQIPNLSGEWETVATAPRLPLANTAHFRVEQFRPLGDTPYRVVVSMADESGKLHLHFYDGTIRKAPRETDPLTIALISCTKNYTGDLRWNDESIWFPHREVAEAISTVTPDLFISTGDQIYEGDLTSPVLSPDEAMMLDYHGKWTRWLWSFGEITRRTPTITIPDDHDVYHGNIWGAGNVPAPKREGHTVQDRGGYKLPPHLVNAVHATQTSHLPDPVDPTPISGGISVYFTRLEYGGVSFAILADRMWKSAPSSWCPKGRVKNGWARVPEFDWLEDGDPKGAQLLGLRQEEFLAEWATDYSDSAWLKVAVSQSVFANLATLPPPANSDAPVPSLPIPRPGEYPPGEVVAADADSNGWPRAARNRAVSLLRLGGALHLTGDQHLASVLRYGVDEAGDAGVVFGGPAVANTWPRRWFPDSPGKNRPQDAPKNLGDFRDGFGNWMRVLAVANPMVTGRTPARLHDRVPGFGLIRLEPSTQSITLECWPRGIDPLDEEASQYPGWPITVHARELDGRTPWGLLPPVTSPEEDDPRVVRVRREPSGDLLSARRLARGETWRPPVFEPGSYTVEIGDGISPWEVRAQQRPEPIIDRSAGQ